MGCVFACVLVPVDVSIHRILPLSLTLALSLVKKTRNDEIQLWITSTSCHDRDITSLDVKCHVSHPIVNDNDYYYDNANDKECSESTQCEFTVTVSISNISNKCE